MSNETRSVEASLEEVARWKSEEEQRQATELAEVDQEVESLKSAVANLEQQLEALNRFRAELETKASGVEAVLLEKSYDAVFSSLSEQSESIARRTAELHQAASDRSEELTRVLEDPEIAALKKEVDAFDAASVEALPESYRAPVLAHHEAQQEKLRAHLERAGPGPVSLDAEVITIDVVLSVDAPDGSPELLIMVVPVTGTIHTEWSDRPEDLQSMIGMRVVQGFYETAKACGLENAQALFGEHQGLLAIEAELDSAPADFGAQLQTTLKTLFEGSSEISAARVQVRTPVVPTDYLLPPEDGEEEEGEDDAQKGEENG